MPEKRSHETIPTKGVVTAKTCDCCGHHEIGIILENGRFLALKPGMMVEILEPLTED